MDRQRQLAALAYACIKNAEKKLTLGGIPDPQINSLTDIASFNEAVKERTSQLLDFLLVSPEADGRILGKAREIADRFRDTTGNPEVDRLVGELRELLDQRDTDLASATR